MAMAMLWASFASANAIDDLRGGVPTGQEVRHLLDEMATRRRHVDRAERL
ncbi:MAG: hypothetical protein R2695_20645 [Acidimicrobiales bacterium]